LQALGDTAEAMALFETAADVSKEVLGAFHPDTLGCLNNLAYLLESTGQYAQAEPLYLPYGSGALEYEVNADRSTLLLAGWVAIVVVILWVALFESALFES